MRHVVLSSIFLCCSLLIACTEEQPSPPRAGQTLIGSNPLS